MFPGMNLNPRQMKQMMRQLGIKQEELLAKKVVFYLENKKLIILEPQVSIMDLGQKKTYIIMGGKQKTKETKQIPEEDIELVAKKTKKTRKEAEKALKESNGDIAKAILKLS